MNGEGRGEGTRFKSETPIKQTRHRRKSKGRKETAQQGGRARRLVQAVTLSRTGSP